MGVYPGTSWLLLVHVWNSNILDIPLSMHAVKQLLSHCPSNTGSVSSLLHVEDQMTTPKLIFASLKDNVNWHMTKLTVWWTWAHFWNGSACRNIFVLVDPGLRWFGEGTWSGPDCGPSGGWIQKQRRASEEKKRTFGRDEGGSGPQCPCPRICSGGHGPVFSKQFAWFCLHPTDWLPMLLPPLGAPECLVFFSFMFTKDVHLDDMQVSPWFVEKKHCDSDSVLSLILCERKRKHDVTPFWYVAVLRRGYQSLKLRPFRGIVKT